MMQDVLMHGSGNRFLIHVGDQDAATLMNKLCGADGLLLLSSDEHSDLYMQIFNADGSEAEQCGNGLRCVALHAFRSQIVQSTTVTIRTLAGINKCVVYPESNEVEVTIGLPEVGPNASGANLDAIADLPEMQFINMGNPNAVLWTKGDPLEIRQEFGPIVARHRGFTEGINLHVARLDSNEQATIASWERGVGPTLASGTGGASVFVASNQPSPFVVTSVGGSLTYSKSDDGQIVMRGPATYD